MAAEDVIKKVSFIIYRDKVLIITTSMALPLIVLNYALMYPLLSMQILSAESDEQLAQIRVSDDYLSVAGGILALLQVIGALSGSHV